MITRWSAYNFKGGTWDEELGKLTLVHGPNRSHKTARVQAAQLALLGYVPGRKPVRSAIPDYFAGARSQLAVGLETDGAGGLPPSATRSWKRGKSGWSYDGPKGSLVLTEALDVDAYLDMTGPARTAYMMAKLGAAATAVEARDSLVAEVKQIQVEEHGSAAEQAIRAVVEELGSVPATGSATSWLEAAVAKLHESSLVSAQAVTRLRKTVQGLSTGWQGPIPDESWEEDAKAKDTQVEVARDAAAAAEAKLDAARDAWKEVDRQVKELEAPVAPGQPQAPAPEMNTGPRPDEGPLNLARQELEQASKQLDDAVAKWGKTSVARIAAEAALKATRELAQHMPRLQPVEGAASEAEIKEMEREEAAQREAWLAARDRLGDITKAFAKVAERHASLAGKSECPTCGHQLDDPAVAEEAWAAAQAKAKLDSDAAAKESQALEERYKATRDTLHAARQKASRARQAAERSRDLAELDEQQKRQAQAAAEARREDDEAKRLEAEASRRREQAQTRLAALESELRAWDARQEAYHAHLVANAKAREATTDDRVRTQRLEGLLRRDAELREAGALARQECMKAGGALALARQVAEQAGERRKALYQYRAHRAAMARADESATEAEAHACVCRKAEALAQLASKRVVDSATGPLVLAVNSVLEPVGLCAEWRDGELVLDTGATHRSISDSESELLRCAMSIALAALSEGPRIAVVGRLESLDAQWGQRLLASCQDMVDSGRLDQCLLVSVGHQPPSYWPGGHTINTTETR